MDAELKEKLDSIEERLISYGEVHVKNGRDRTWKRSEFDQWIFDRLTLRGVFGLVVKVVLFILAVSQIIQVVRTFTR